VEHRIVCFNSRNKDNNHLKDQGYRQRSYSFLTAKMPDELMDKFHSFVERGLNGEVSRFYISVNTRNHDKALQELTVALVRGEISDLSKIEGKVASIAGKKECRGSRLFLLDCDCDENEFGIIKEYLNRQNVVVIKQIKTKNNYALITQPFDPGMLNVADKRWHSPLNKDKMELWDALNKITHHIDDYEYVTCATKGAL